MSSAEFKARKEEFQCCNKACPENWVDTVTEEDSKYKYYTVRLCPSCTEQGYTIVFDLTGTGVVTLLKYGDTEDEYGLFESTKNNRPKFIPCEKLFQCYNKSCSNNWTEMIYERKVSLLDFPVCPSCKDHKYSINVEFDANGYLLYLFKDGEKVDTYTSEEALTDNPPKPKKTFEPYETEYQCGNKSCSTNWKENVYEKIPMKICGGYARVCNDCKKKGYSVYDGIGDGRFYLSKDNEDICSYTFEEAYALNKEVPVFQPYKRTFKCGNKSCTNTWDKIIKRQPPMMFCGGDARVCPTCEEQGYSVFDGDGGGMFHLSKDGAEIDVYNRKVAYNRVTSDETLDELSRYTTMELENGNFTIDKSSKVMGEGWAVKVNNKLKELGSNVHIHAINDSRIGDIPSGDRSSYYILYDVDGPEYIMKYSVEAPYISMEVIPGN